MEYIPVRVSDIIRQLNRDASEDLIKNIHGAAPVAELNGDEIGFLVATMAEIKRQK